MVSKLSRRRLFYGWGGARQGGIVVGPKRAGEAWTDCSGLALYLARVAGIPLENGAGSTWSMASEGEAGTSPYMTWFIKNTTVEDAHVIIRLRKRPRWWRRSPAYRWAECGGYDNPSPGGGPSWFEPTEARIAEFPIHRHFAAL